MIKTNEKNGHDKVNPEKTWDKVSEDDPDTWFEDQPEIPGQERIVNLDTLKKELLGDEDQGDVTN